MTDEMNGHEQLCHDIIELLAEALDYEFHDFKNTKYAVPKIELHKRLLLLDQNLKAGLYDNDADEDDRQNIAEILKEMLSSKGSGHQ